MGMKGIVLAAGRGSRLYPMTSALSKEVLPVYDKPMIYYSLATVMLAGIREIMVIANSDNHRILANLLGDGSKWGISICFEVQREPRGIADALLIARRFAGRDKCLLTLGDNILIGPDVGEQMSDAARNVVGSTIFGFQVSNPEQYGIVSLDESGSPTAIVEKPASPDSNWAVPGIYFYDSQVFDIAAGLEPSGRGELEISDVNARYLAEGRMTLHCLGKEYSWFDAGTPDRFLDAANYIRNLTENLGRCVMVPEEIAHSEGWISTGQLVELGRSMLPSSYGNYLLALSEGKMTFSTT